MSSKVYGLDLVHEVKYLYTWINFKYGAYPITKIAHMVGETEEVIEDILGVHQLKRPPAQFIDSMIYGGKQ